MPVTTTTQIPAPVRDFYNKVVLVRALPFLHHDKFGQEKELPLRSGDRMVFRRYDALAVNTTPLTEGTTPAGKQASKTDIVATLSQYGDFIEYSDMVSLVVQDPVLTEFAEVLGEQAGQSLDLVYRDILVAGTEVIYSNGSSRSAVNTVIDADDLDRAIRALSSQNARPISRIIEASTGIGTVPIRPAYFAIAHPDVMFTVDNISGFKSVEQYASQGPVMEGEVGAYKNIRFLVSTQAKIFPGAGAASTTVRNTGGIADVYVTEIFAQNAYGIVPLSGHSLENIVKPLGSSGTADPLNQRGTTGWKAITTAKILNDKFMLRIESAAAL